MPAQSVASPAMATAVASTTGTTGTATAARAASAGERDPGTAGAQFGRQLDAARSQHGKPAAQDAAKPPKAAATRADDQAQASSAAPEPAAAGAAAAGPVDPATDAIQADQGNGEAGQGHDEHDGDADGDGVPPLAVPALLTFLGAALPGSMAHRGAFASSAGALLGAHGAAAVTAGIADAARMLQSPAADAQAADGQAATAAGTSPGLESILDAVHGLAREDAHDATTLATSAAGVGSAPPAPLPAPAAGTHLLAASAPLGSEAFHQELAGQVVWLASQDVKQARIRVHPENLGPLDLKVSMSHDHVDVVIGVQHPEAAQTLQQNLPQLGQMLAQHGLSLGHAEVGQHGGNGPSAHHHGPAGGAVDETAEAHATATGVVTGTSNLLDAFA